MAANCGHPELPPILNNDSVPSIVNYHDGLPVEGNTITFNCPPGLVLIGPNSSTCADNGEWEPDFSGLMCNDSKGNPY